jgi:hypothetical protein
MTIGSKLPITFPRLFGSHLFLTIKSKCRATLIGSHFFNFPLMSRKVVVINSVERVFDFFGNSWVRAVENKNFKESPSPVF